MMVNTSVYVACPFSFLAIHRDCNIVNEHVILVYARWHCPVVNVWSMSVKKRIVTHLPNNNEDNIQLESSVVL